MAEGIIVLGVIVLINIVLYLLFGRGDNDSSGSGGGRAPGGYDSWRYNMENPANPIGYANPNSPNYRYRHHRHWK